MINEANFSKIIQKTIDKFNVNPYSFLSKIKPKNYSLDFVFKDIRKDERINNVTFKSEKLSKIIEDEFKKQIEKKEFNFAKFKNIILNNFKNNEYANILIVIAFFFLKFIYYIGTSKEKIFLLKHFAIIAFPILFFDLFVDTFIFFREVKKSGNVQIAHANIRKYYEEVNKEEPNILKTIYISKFILIFLTFSFIILVFYFQSVTDIPGGTILLFTIKAVAVILFIFKIIFQTKIKKAQDKYHSSEKTYSTELVPEF